MVVRIAKRNTTLAQYGSLFVRFMSTGRGDFHLDTLSQRRVPGFKLWWAKEVTPKLYVAGGLTDTQIKYAHDEGFKGVISLFHENSPGQFGGEKLASMSEAKYVAKIAGIQFDAILKENEDWACVKAVEKLTDAITKMEKPILLYSRKPQAVAFTSLLHTAYMSKLDSKYEPRVNSEKFYKMSALMGMDFTEDRFKSVVAEITGESIVSNPPKCDAYQNWLGYWLGHPVYKNWFTAGQIRRGHLKELEAAGFKSVINMRVGKTFNNNPSQETVNLINIPVNLNTYDENYIPVRQKPSELEKVVLDPALDRKHISPTSNVNYETENPEEYGDEIGYNEELESEHFKGSSLKYYHLPLDIYSTTFSTDVFKQYKDKLLKIGNDGPVLFHCTIGQRTAFMGVLAAAVQYNKDLQWALKRIHELGFTVNETTFSDVYKMYNDVLGQIKAPR
ncbi:uncharacterized protein LOC143079678 isoform X1 [Mytilus galloprovincialis]|uniref:Uncharacterized protein n=1 Tax=Mytilus galloprovincialis TaxID=29158 RepID=A0A8B6ER88_MYTGA|nr:Hypothetical predicted protein [Mytilus galloprovincialis]